MRHFATENDSLHEYVEKDRQPNTDAAGDYPGFDFVDALYFGRNTAFAFEYFLAALLLFVREKHLRDPGTAPIKLLLALASIDGQPHRRHVRTARFTEL